MNEVWKDIEGYEGLYQVSNLGQVRSLNYNRTGRVQFLKASKGDKEGHLHVVLYKDGQREVPYVHTLVGRAFVPGWFEGAVINHKDHDPSNNVCTNLEWTTQKDNSSREKSRGPEVSAKRFSKTVLQFTKSGDFVAEWLSTMEVERQLGFRQDHICECCNGKLKSAYGYVWKYKA